jgi:hypothetical protein
MLDIKALRDAAGERLTGKDKNLMWCMLYDGPTDFGVYNELIKAMHDRLALYESNVPALLDRLDALEKELALALAKLQELEQAKAEGRLVMLPCKPTDAYYHRNENDGQLELNIELHGGEPDGQFREIHSCAVWE